jgi:DNA-binding Lrp family transcriptional regulator
MPANAYVLLNVEPARTEQVVKQLSTIPGAIVREVTGPYDVVVELERDTVVDLTSVVRSRIRSISGVTSTTTCLWIEGSFSQDAGGE